ncbi:hypothetical protein [Streptomyces sp. NBC_01304]|uniref:hypothetical protein n=1 Tax=Streptomyces sp. NBC_01304 TaxID=2903818 RepID=UPI002E12C7DF|nr:hypothetical protein OG430_49265 [Streptomyces sp. NBC_01304]
MQINGAEGQRPGTALLLAGAPAGKGALVDANSVIPTLAAVAPAAWTGTAATTMIELVDPVEPQAVLTRIRGAALVEGPLTIVLVGQLHLDRKQHALHVALARTTPSTMRYTALPWAWLTGELQQRAPGTTTLYADLVADPEAWQLLDQEPLTIPQGARAYGVIAPPPPRRRIVKPRYTYALAQILRSGYQTGPDQLHLEVLHRAAVPDEALVLGPRPAPTAAVPPANPALAPARPVLPAQAQRPASGVPAAAADEELHEQIAAASKAGDHQLADELAVAAEQRAARTFGPNSFATIHWTEVRAFVASVAQDPAASCQLWLTAAETRLDTLQQATDAHDVESAVDRAHHQWLQLRDPVAARAYAPRLVALRRRVPGRQRGALESIQKMLERLNSLPTR